MQLYEDQFSERHDFATRTAVRTLVLASTPRSGSHMLGHALHMTQAFGFPLEYANPANLAEWKRRLGTVDDTAALRAIQLRRTSPNGIFGIKMHYPHAASLGGIPAIRQIFPDPRFVLLSRKDAVAQAVSFAIAAQTQVWIDGQEPVSDTVTYDFEDIDRRLRDVIAGTAAWRYALASTDCSYLDLDFDLVRDGLPESVRRIADFMDVEVDARQSPDRQVTRQQSSTVNAEWTRRFLDDVASGRRSSTPARSSARFVRQIRVALGR